MGVSGVLAGGKGESIPDSRHPVRTISSGRKIRTNSRDKDKFAGQIDLRKTRFFRPASRQSPPSHSPFRVTSKKGPLKASIFAAKKIAGDEKSFRIPDGEFRMPRPQSRSEHYAPLTRGWGKQNPKGDWHLTPSRELSPAVDFPGTKPFQRAKLST